MSEGHKIQPLPDAKRSIFLSLIYESGKLIMLFAMQFTNVGVYGSESGCYLVAFLNRTPIY